MGGRNDGVPKKITAKQTRSIKYISGETKIKIGDTPTKNVVICNSGLALGLSQEDVILTFGQEQGIENIVMLPNKTYCFVVFKDVSKASQVYTSLHGKGRLPGCDHLVVLAFSERVPEVSYRWGSAHPPGLILLESFVTVEEEEKLLQCIHWDESAVGSSLKHRQVQHFGYEFCYTDNDVDSTTPLEKAIPVECNFLSGRMAKRGYSTWGFMPDQLTVNRYLPGQGIPPHVDTHSVFNDPILSLSLKADVVMEFRDSCGKHVPIILPRRSLLILSGESRYGWTHGITPRMNDIVPASNGQGLTLLPRSERISFTFRTLCDKRECFCNYPSLCDYQKKTLFTDQKDAVILENRYVHQVYEQISDHFSATRHKAWPKVLEFVQSLKPGAILVDVGCGNGKYFGQRSKDNPIFELGCDASQSLASLCAERGFQVLTCNCLALPYRSSIADGCLCIAVIHHLSTWERRRKAIQELVRILRPGGRALVYVWARNQQKDNIMSAYLKQDRRNRRTEATSEISSKTETEQCSSSEGRDCSEASQASEDSACKCKHACKNHSCADEDTSENSVFHDVLQLPLPVHASRTEFKCVDVLVPWKIKPEYQKSTDLSPECSDDNTLLRFYHVFEEGELEQLCSEIPQIQILQVGYEQGNWVVMLRKLP